LPETPTCFAISDGAAGNERQAVALADAMGLQARRFRLALAPPWSWLAPRLVLGAWSALP
jgi:mitochondrial fission protein ELM1